jgi:hypothetical protein
MRAQAAFHLKHLTFMSASNRFDKEFLNLEAENEHVR